MVVNAKISTMELVDFQSYPLRMEYSETKGRYVVAKQLICQGDVVVKVLPYATAIFDSYKKRVCAFCLFWHPTRSLELRCINCDQVYFCSRLCMRQYFDNGPLAHIRICSALRKLATLKATKHLKSIVKLMLNTLWERRREEAGVKWFREREWWEKTKENISGVVKVLNESQEKQLDDLIYLEDETALPILTSNYSLIERLQSHYSNWLAEDKAEWRKVQNNILTMLYQANLLNEGESIDYVMHLISRLESNGFGLYVARNNKKVKKNVLCFGRAVFPHASFFNHDCACNCDCFQYEEETCEEQIEPTTALEVTPAVDCVCITQGCQCLQRPCSNSHLAILPFPGGGHRVMTISAVRNVSPSEMLTISYISAEDPVSLRRQKLHEGYYFECDCEKCISEAGTGKRKGGKGNR